MAPIFIFNNLVVKNKKRSFYLYFLMTLYLKNYDVQPFPRYFNIYIPIMHVCLPICSCLEGIAGIASERAV